MHQLLGVRIQGDGHYVTHLDGSLYSLVVTTTKSLRVGLWPAGCCVVKLDA